MNLVSEPDDRDRREQANAARLANAETWQRAIDAEWDRLRPHLTDPDYQDAIEFNALAHEALIAELKAIGDEYEQIASERLALMGDTIADFGLADEGSI